MAQTIPVCYRMIGFLYRPFEYGKTGSPSRQPGRPEDVRCLLLEAQRTHHLDPWFFVSPLSFVCRQIYLNGSNGYVKGKTGIHLAFGEADPMDEVENTSELPEAMGSPGYRKL